MRRLLLLTFCLAILSTGCAKQHQFELVLQPASEPANLHIKKLLDAGQFPELIDGLNRCFRLPTNVDIVFLEGEKGAHYEKNQVFVTYDFLAELREKLDTVDPKLNDTQKDGIIFATAHFVLLHELGHALIDVLDIPVVGGEEDAVDGLAAVIAVGLLHEPELAVAAALAMSAEEDSFTEQEFWDEHSLNAQRYYNILCWVHGGAPEQCEQLVGTLAPEGWFEDRAGKCEEEYDKLSRSWSRLLEPHLRPGVRILAKANRRLQERAK